MGGGSTHFITPVAWRVKTQPTPALRRVVGGDYLRAKLSFTTGPLLAGSVACNGTYELG